MKQTKSKTIFAWIILFVLIGATLILTYFKFFSADNSNITEIPTNNSTSNAIHKALKDITINFNQSPAVQTYNEQNNVKLNATANNFSIYISYITDTTTTYEFTYDNLHLNIIINSNEAKAEKFNVVYKFLIEAVQKRINNTNDINEEINKFLNNDDISYEGLTKKVVEDNVEYQMDITKKIKTNK